MSSSASMISPLKRSFSFTKWRRSGFQSSRVRLVGGSSSLSRTTIISSHQQFSRALGRLRWLTFSLSLRKIGIACSRNFSRGMVVSPQFGNFPSSNVSNAPGSFASSPSSGVSPGREASGSRYCLSDQSSPLKIPVEAKSLNSRGRSNGIGCTPQSTVAGLSKKSFSISE